MTIKHSSFSRQHIRLLVKVNKIYTQIIFQLEDPGQRLTSQAELEPTIHTRWMRWEAANTFGSILAPKPQGGNLHNHPEKKRADTIRPTCEHFSWPVDNIIPALFRQAIVNCFQRQ